MIIKNGQFHLNGKPFFLYSGETHYFRIPQRYWRARLKDLKAAGFNAVSTYVPWSWHEPEEGQFDFTGKTHPERNLLKFIKMAHEEKLYFFARVGPVSNAELKGEGVPQWVFDSYPDVHVKGDHRHGSLPHDMVLSYLHPQLQGLVDSWYSQLLPLIRKNVLSQGGNIIGVQLCNEIAMIHWLQKAADYRPHVTRLYQHFLKEKYGVVEKVNKAHNASHQKFEDIHQPDAQQFEMNKMAVYHDWALFYRRYYATYYRTLSERAQKHEIDVPFFCNIPQFYDYDIRGRGVYAPMTTSLFRDFSLLTPYLVFGGAYQMRHLDFENFHDVCLTTEVTRLLSTVRPKGRPEALNTEERLPREPEFEVTEEPVAPTVCAELQTGIMRDRPRLYPQQVLLNIKSSVGQGLGGVNAYMFAGGINPPGYGAFGTYHDWQAPVSVDGVKKPHYKPLQEFGQFLKWGGELLAQTRKATDTAIGFYLPNYSTEYYKGDDVQNLETQRTYLWYDGLARLIQLAGYSFHLLDLQRTPAEMLQKNPSLWVFSMDVMDRPTQQKLADYVKLGGKLFIYPNVPSKDFDGRPENTLAQELGLGQAKALDQQLFTYKKKDYWVQGPLQVYPEAKSQRAYLSVDKKGDVVFQRSVGKGLVHVIGCGLPHVFDHYRDWVRQWAQGAKVTPLVNCDPWDVQATLRSNKDFGFLFVYNYHFTPREAVLTLKSPGTRQALKLPSRGKLHLEPFTALILPLNIPLSEDVRLVYSTAEVRDAKVAGGSKITVTAVSRPGSSFEVVLKTPRKPKSARLDGKKASFTWSKGQAKIVAQAAQNSAKLVVTL